MILGDKSKRPIKIIDCPCCYGSGRQFLKVSGDAPKPGVYLVTCSFCKGAKKINQSEVDALDREQAEWCNCTEQTDVHHYQDGGHDDITKHHWRCRNCGGITQIG
jgi:hypothetical protein